MEYTEAVILEAMRMNPPFGMLLRKCTRKEGTAHFISSQIIKQAKESNCS
jgi:hypothetical protein